MNRNHWTRSLLAISLSLNLGIAGVAPRTAQIGQHVTCGGVAQQSEHRIDLNLRHGWHASDERL